MTKLSPRLSVARGSCLFAAILGLAACSDNRPLQSGSVYIPSAPENAGYTPRRGPNQSAPRGAYVPVGTYIPAAPDDAALRDAFARNPSTADVAHLKNIGRPLTQREIADVSIVILRDVCGIPENQRMSPEGNCAPGQ